MLLQRAMLDIFVKSERKASIFAPLEYHNNEALMQTLGFSVFRQPTFWHITSHALQEKLSEWRLIGDFHEALVGLPVIAP
jgi:hypothetical protein